MAIAIQEPVRLGQQVALRAVKNGVTMTGGKWVVEGAGSGSVDVKGVYTAPLVAPPTNPVLVSYTANGLTVAVSLALLNPVPVVTSVTPSTVSALSTPIVVTGIGFVQGSTILINGKSIQTAFIDSSHLSGVLVLANTFNSTTQVAVSNPAPGATISGSAAVNAVFGPNSPFNTASFFREQSDDFAGPFNSWTNIKQAYGAVGDGIADDTNAIQNAINGLTDDSTSCVLWLPAGNYKITRTLLFTHKHNFRFVGEDPRTTVIKWAGPGGGTMIETDGSAYFQLSRFSLDGNGLADTAENITTITQNASTYYSTYNELADQHILGVNAAVRLGVDSETLINRVFFDNIPTVGVVTGFANTLNIFVNDSLFVNCGTGLSDAIDNGGGGFMVTNSYFVNSRTADMSIANTGVFTARHNTSISSATFFLSYEIYGNSSSITLQDNTILDPKSAPFQFGNLGPFMLIDNVVRLQNSAIPIIQGGWSTFQKDVFSIGNTYTANAGVVTPGFANFQGRLVLYDDRTVSLGSIADVAVPSNVYIPPNNHSTVFEVTQPTGAALQSAITAAVASGLTRPSVHMAKGSYNLTQTVSFPLGANVELVGDGVAATVLNWNGPAGSPMLKIPTSNVSVKHLELYGNQAGDGIQLPLADEPNTQIIADQLLAGDGTAIGVSFDGLEHATSELASSYIYGTQTGIRATGGLFRADKEGTLGTTNHYSGSLQSVGSATSFDVSLGGKLMVQDNWHDLGLSSPQNFKLSGSGTVTEQGGGVFMTSSKPFEIDNFDGKVTLLGLIFNGGFQLSPGDKHTDLLNLGLVSFSSNFLPTSTGNAFVQNVLNSTSGSHIATSDTPANSWLRGMLAQTRTEYPIKRVGLSDGSNRIRLERVAVLASNVGFHVLPDAIKTGLYYGLSSGATTLANTTDACISTNGTSTTNQWLLISAGEGDFEIVSRSTGQAIGFAVSTTQTPVMEALSGQYDQRWMIEQVGDGTFRFRNRQTNEFLSLRTTPGCVGFASGSDTNWTITAR